MNKERNKIIANNIRKYLKETGMTQKKLAELINIKPSTLSDYLNLRSNPSHGVIQKIADVFGIVKSDIDTTYKENNDITSIYNKLTPPRQQNVLNYAHGQLEEQNAKNDNVIQMVTLSRIHASAAGVVGEELFDDIYEEEVEFEADKVPKGADYCVLVNGDSMEPMIRDGSCAFIKKTDTVADGTIALVIVDGAGYIKRVDIYDNVIRLVSLNPKYEDIIVQSHHDMKVCGKVVL
ncbi:XRE family transcriptional regulator [Staphylococcus agnetis]|uniref:Peptidase S24 n=1 Tax=Staphylococcus agnetis TaxID=985762 RepID=A0ABX3Z5L7_9STAP|nr:XRE family transcriptional regulator [Staphylococcus agnetis]ALN76787.1 helix-turn-helix transcriptional regulator [Staphylococcus agnetis]NJI12085.1 helix-turn-helix domain-containing protein [Staphylococcus agnetis]OSP20391.1 peptidase S24 [Staphylococcus agnetis]OSP25166.1 peptidase S24 [Staphylococcus agnetis]OTW31191.1 peptidase S24 [Staphylococcus agnetis]